MFCMHLNFFVLAFACLSKSIYAFQGSIYNSLSVEYGHGKWKNFTGTQSFDLIEIGSQFSITLKVTVDRPLKISLSYSKSPGKFFVFISNCRH